MCERALYDLLSRLHWNASFFWYLKEMREQYYILREKNDLDAMDDFALNQYYKMTLGLDLEKAEMWSQLVKLMEKITFQQEVIRGKFVTTCYYIMEGKAFPIVNTRHLE